MRWRRRKSGRLRAFRYEIGRRQIEVQRQAVDHALFLKRHETANKVAGPEDFEEIRQLEIQLAICANTLQEFSARPRQKTTWLDLLVIRLWEWSTAERFG